jgi:hypothetical protein
MRIKAGSTAEQVVEQLNTKQRRALQSAQTARAAEQKALDSHRKRKEDTAERVARALEAGVPAALVASQLGFTKARVYQMRDKIRMLQAVQAAQNGETANHH